MSNIIKFEWNDRIIELTIADSTKPLRLSYELAWRTPADEKFRRSALWKTLRRQVLERDHNRCQYCGFESPKNMHVNHIDGNPKNNELSNLEVICSQCHMFLHSGLWCEVQGIIDCYAESAFTQSEIVHITRRLREMGAPDHAIIRFLGLRKPMPWRQDLDYLSGLYGFMTSRMPHWSRNKPLLTEEQQKLSLENREYW